MLNNYKQWILSLLLVTVSAQASPEVDLFLEQSLQQIESAKPELGANTGSNDGYTLDNHSWPSRMVFFDLLGLIQRQTTQTKPLDDSDRLNLELFNNYLKSEMMFQRQNMDLLPLNQMEGIQLLQGEAELKPFDNQEDYENWLSLLNQVPERITQDITLLEAGLTRGRYLPKHIVNIVADQVSAHLVANPSEAPLMEVFNTFPDTVDPDTQTRLQKEAQLIIEEQITPAYQKLHDYLTKTYISQAPSAIGLTQQKNGEAAYSAMIQYHTSLNLSAEEIHNIGLEEVNKLAERMQSIQEKLKYSGNLQQFLAHIKTQPELFFETREEVINAYRALAKQLDYQLPKLFESLPAMPYGVEPIPQALEATSPGAYYDTQLLNDTWVGCFSINTSRPKTRPRFIVPTLTLHEAVPGHHFQIALAQELKDVPRFRQHSLVGGENAFIEGWALYSETLGYPLGLYEDPYAELGHLSESMWRACRLVVDTGIHAKGWSRQQAIDFMAQYLTDPLPEIEVEVDRYIVWPGQALSYKLGQLNILALRDKAKQQLGDDFSLPNFHTWLLENGSVPLNVLNRHVEQKLGSVDK